MAGTRLLRFRQSCSGRCKIDIGTLKLSLMWVLNRVHLSLEHKQTHSNICKDTNKTKLFTYGKITPSSNCLFFFQIISKASQIACVCCQKMKMGKNGMRIITTGKKIFVSVSIPKETKFLQNLNVIMVFLVCFIAINRR